MQMNKTNNIIFLKKIESNFIQEAIIILKYGIKIDDKEINNQDEKNFDKKTNILKEAEFIINSKLENVGNKYDKFKIDKLENKIKKLKIMFTISTIIGMLAIIVR